MTDVCFCVQLCVVQATGKSISMVVLQERERWIILTNHSHAALALMQRQCEARRWSSPGLQTFTQADAQPPSHFKIPQTAKTPVQQPHLLFCSKVCRGLLNPCAVPEMHRSTLLPVVSFAVLPHPVLVWTVSPHQWQIGNTWIFTIFPTPFYLLSQYTHFIIKDFARMHHLQWSRTLNLPRSQLLRQRHVWKERIYRLFVWCHLSVGSVHGIWFLKRCMAKILLQFEVHHISSTVENM